MLLTGGIWFLWVAWVEERVDVWVNFRSLYLSSMSTIVTLDTLDPDTSTVVAHVSTSTSEPSLFLFDPTVSKQIPALKNLDNIPARSKYRIYYLRPEIRDLSSSFNLLGLRMISQVTYHPAFDRVKDSLLGELPRDGSVVLSILGDPRMFPFDQYRVVCEVQAGAFLEYDKQIAPIDSGFSVLPRFPGFVVRQMSKEELQGGSSPLREGIDRNTPTANQYNPQFWSESGIAISAERPLFLRVLTIVLGVAALVSLAFVYLLSEPSKYFLNSLGAFAALWGVRSILTASAPKTPNVVDFAVLVLFIVQIILVAVRSFVARGKHSDRTTSATESPKS